MILTQFDSSPSHIRSIFLICCGPLCNRPVYREHLLNYTAVGHKGIAPTDNICWSWMLFHTTHASRLESPGFCNFHYCTYSTLLRIYISHLDVVTGTGPGLVMLSPVTAMVSPRRVTLTVTRARGFISDSPRLFFPDWCQCFVSMPRNIVSLNIVSLYCLSVLYRVK